MTLTATPASTPDWRTPLRAGLVLLGVALGGSFAASELAGTAAATGALAMTAAPLVGIAGGVLLLLRALPRLARAGRMRTLARRVEHALGDEFAVLASYHPRAGREVEIDLVVVGPTGVFAIEVCELVVELACYDDVWYRRHGSAAWRLPASPSIVARWKSSRLKLDVASSGFARTGVEPVVLIPYSRAVEINGCSTNVLEGLGALAKYVRGWNGSPLSESRARAIARTLSGTLGIAS